MVAQEEKLGFVGGGQMGEALIRGVLGAGLYGAGQILVAEPAAPRRELLSERYKVESHAEAGPLFDSCQTIILAVKPQVMEPVLRQNAARIKAGANLLISIAAGVPLAVMEKALAPEPVPFIRVMPNTPALVLEAASALAPGTHAGEEDMKKALAVFAAVGKTVVLPEASLDAVTGLSGSGPAYVFTFLEALIDAGIKTGLSRDVAELLARQTIIGSLKLAAESGKHPAELRAMVTSPGGTTIAGLHALERGAFRSLIMDAVEAATRRSIELRE